MPDTTQIVSSEFVKTLEVMVLDQDLLDPDGFTALHKYFRYLGDRLFPHDIENILERSHASSKESSGSKYYKLDEILEIIQVIRERLADIEGQNVSSPHEVEVYFDTAFKNKVSQCVPADKYNQHMALCHKIAEAYTALHPQAETPISAQDHWIEDQAISLEVDPEYLGVLTQKLLPEFAAQNHHPYTPSTTLKMATDLVIYVDPLAPEYFKPITSDEQLQREMAAVSLAGLGKTNPDLLKHYVSLVHQAGDQSVSSPIPPISNQTIDDITEVLSQNKPLSYARENIQDIFQKNTGVDRQKASELSNQLTAFVNQNVQSEEPSQEKIVQVLTGLSLPPSSATSITSTLLIQSDSEARELSNIVKNESPLSVTAWLTNTKHLSPADAQNLTPQIIYRVESSGADPVSAVRNLPVAVSSSTSTPAVVYVGTSSTTPLLSTPAEAQHLYTLASNRDLQLATSQTVDFLTQKNIPAPQIAVLADSYVARANSPHGSAENLRSFPVFIDGSSPTSPSGSAAAVSILTGSTLSDHLVDTVSRFTSSSDKTAAVTQELVKTGAASLTAAPTVAGQVLHSLGQIPTSASATDKAAAVQAVLTQSATAAPPTAPPSPEALTKSAVTSTTILLDLAPPDLARAHQAVDQVWSTKGTSATKEDYQAAFSAAGFSSGTLTRLTSTAYQAQDTPLSLSTPNPSPLIIASATAALVALNQSKSADLTPEVHDQAVNWVKTQASAGQVIAAADISTQLQLLGVKNPQPIITAFTKESAAAVGLASQPLAYVTPSETTISTLYAAREAVSKSNLSPEQRSALLSDLSTSAQEGTLTAITAADKLNQHKISLDDFTSSYTRIQSQLQPPSAPPRVLTYAPGLSTPISPSVSEAITTAFHQAPTPSAALPQVAALISAATGQPISPTIQDQASAALVAYQQNYRDHVVAKFTPAHIDQISDLARSAPDSQTAIDQVVTYLHTNVTHLSPYQRSDIAAEIVPLVRAQTSPSSAVRETRRVLDLYTNPAAVPQAIGQSISQTTPIKNTSPFSTKDQALLSQPLSQTQTQHIAEIIRDTSAYASDSETRIALAGKRISQEAIPNLSPQGGTIIAAGVFSSLPSQPVTSAKLEYLTREFLDRHHTSAVPLPVDDIEKLLNGKLKLKPEEKMAFILKNNGVAKELAPVLAKNIHDFNVLSDNLTDKSTSAQNQLFRDYLVAGLITHQTAQNTVPTNISIKNVSSLPDSTVEHLRFAYNRFNPSQDTTLTSVTPAVLIQNFSRFDPRTQTAIQNLFRSDESFTASGLARIFGSSEIASAFLKEKLDLAVPHLATKAKETDLLAFGKLRADHDQNSLTLALKYLQDTHTPGSAVHTRATQLLEKPLSKDELAQLQFILALRHSPQDLKAAFYSNAKPTGFFLYITNPKKFVGDVEKLKGTVSSFLSHPNSAKFIQYVKGRLSPEELKKFVVNISGMGMIKPYMQSLVVKGQKTIIYKGLAKFAATKVGQQILKSAAVKAVSKVAVNVLLKLGIQVAANAIAPGIGEIVALVIGFVIDIIGKIVHAIFGKALQKMSSDISEATKGGAMAYLSFFAAATQFSGIAIAIGMFISAIAAVMATIVITLFKPFIITFIVIPTSIAFFMLIINSGAYMVPPSSTSLSIGPIGTFPPVFTNASSCPLNNGRIVVPSYNPYSQTGHGSNSYWGIPEPVPANRCYLNIPADGNSFRAPISGPSNYCYQDYHCEVSTNPGCSQYYGFAIDVTSSDHAVSAPQINGHNTTWVYANEIGMPVVNGFHTTGYAYHYYTIDSSNNTRYDVHLVHLNQLSPPQTNVVSGQVIGSLYPQGNNTHLHIELQINPNNTNSPGVYVKPEGYFCN